MENQLGEYNVARQQARDEVRISNLEKEKDYMWEALDKQRDSIAELKSKLQGTVATTTIIQTIVLGAVMYFLTK